MSRNFSTERHPFRSAVVLVMFAVGVPCALGADEIDPVVVTPIDLNTTTRVSSLGVERRCFETEVYSAGILTLDASVSGLELTQPVIALYGDTCSGPEDDGGSCSLVARTPTSMVLEIHAPGAYAFCIGAQDPARTLDAVKIRNGFASGGLRAAEDGAVHEPSPAPWEIGKSEEDEDYEPPPDPLFGGCVVAKSEEEGEYEPPPDPKARLENVRRSLCQSGEADDHGDTPLCSTPLARGRVVGGEIRNAWGDDHDYFVFALTRQRTVHVETTGDTDTVGGLYDRYGCRIAADDDGGEHGNFRIVKTLSPGIYYVRVEGRDRKEGSYQIGPWPWP